MGGSHSTEFFEAAKTGNRKLIKKMVKDGYNVNVTDLDGWTAATFAANHGHIHCLAELIQAKADINVRDELGATPLMYASYNGFVEIVDMLLELGCIKNAQRIDTGQTALHLAAQQGRGKVVESLLRGGGCKTLKDYKGNTADSLAQKDSVKQHLARTWTEIPDPEYATMSPGSWDETDMARTVHTAANNDGGGGGGGGRRRSGSHHSNPASRRNSQDDTAAVDGGAAVTEASRPRKMSTHGAIGGSCDVDIGDTLEARRKANDRRKSEVATSRVMHSIEQQLANSLSLVEKLQREKASLTEERNWIRGEAAAAQSSLQTEQALRKSQQSELERLRETVFEQEDLVGELKQSRARVLVLELQVKGLEAHNQELESRATNDRQRRAMAEALIDSLQCRGIDVTAEMEKLRQASTTSL